MQGGGILAECKLRHDGQHACARRGFEHHVAGPDHGCLERGVGERQRRRELLIPELVLGAPRLGGLERGEGFQHAQHGGGTVRAGAGFAPHGAAVALEEQHQRRLGRLVGVLPDPGALGVGAAEGGGHGAPQDRGVEAAAGLEYGQQGGGRGDQCGGRGDGILRQGQGSGEMRRRWWGGGRRRGGVEHGAGSGSAWNGRPAGVS